MEKNGKPIGIKDLAEALGLTPSTVSRALRGNTRISEETRQRVKQQAKLMNYSHNSAAASLRTGKSKILGVIIPLANRSFFASVISGIETVANNGKYSVMICQTNEDSIREKAAVTALLKARVDGIAVSVSAGTTDFGHFQSVKDAQIPLITFDRTFDEIGAHQVLIDDRMGGKMATDHLIAQGCRRILHIGGRQHMTIYKNRTQGYLDSLKSAGIEVDDNLLIVNDTRENSASEAVQMLLEKGIAFDGIFAASDYAAIGAMKRLQSNGIQVPSEVAIVGFADEPFTKWVTPSLSTVNQHSEAMGNAIANLFLSLMDKKVDGPPPLNKVVLMPELVVRESSMRQN